MYQVHYKSKKYQELKKLCGAAGRKCIECGALLIHPQSILSHTGPVCLENRAKKTKE